MQFSEHTAICLPTQDLADRASEAGSFPATVNDPITVSFDVVTTIDGFLELETDWRRLQAANAGPVMPFQSFGWLKTWISAAVSVNPQAAAKPELHIVCGRSRNGNLVIVLPLMACRGRWISVAAWLGVPIAQYGDILLHRQFGETDLVKRAFDAARELVPVDVFCLEKVRDDAIVRSHLDTSDAEHHRSESAPFIRLGAGNGVVRPQSAFSGKARKNRRRLRRRLSENFSVVSKEVPPGTEAAKVALAGLQLKRQWLNDRGLVSGALNGDEVADFLARSAASPASGCRVFALYCDDTLAGVQIGFTAGDRLALFLIVFDLQFEKSGVGVLQLEDTISNLEGSGTTVLDLLAPDAKYKSDWSDGAISVDDYNIACTTRGRLFARFYLDLLRPRLKAQYLRLPMFVRRFCAVCLGG